MEVCAVFKMNRKMPSLCIKDEHKIWQRCDPCVLARRASPFASHWICFNLRSPLSQIRDSVSVRERRHAVFICWVFISDQWNEGSEIQFAPPLTGCFSCHKSDYLHPRRAEAHARQSDQRFHAPAAGETKEEVEAQTAEERLGWTAVHLTLVVRFFFSVGSGKHELSTASLPVRGSLYTHTEKNRCIKLPEVDRSWWCVI